LLPERESGESSVGVERRSGAAANGELEQQRAAEGSGGGEGRQEQRRAAVERLRRWHRVEERDRTEKREIGGREMWWERERSMRKFMAARVHDLEKVSGSWSGENGGKKKQRGRDRRADHFIYGTEVV
jgi:hypothetical protein